MIHAAGTSMDSDKNETIKIIRLEFTMVTFEKCNKLFIYKMIFQKYSWQVWPTFQVLQFIWGWVRCLHTFQQEVKKKGKIHVVIVYFLLENLWIYPLQGVHSFTPGSHPSTVLTCCFNPFLLEPEVVQLLQAHYEPPHPVLQQEHRHWNIWNFAKQFWPVT